MHCWVMSGHSWIEMGQLLDLAAVFDIVNHDLLTYCITNIGVCGTALKQLISPELGTKGAFGEIVSSLHLLVLCSLGGSLFPSVIQYLHVPPCPARMELWAWFSPVC